MRCSGVALIAPGYSPGMGLVIALIVLAVIFGLVGLFVTALKWLLIVAVVLLVVGVARGVISGRRAP
jgi:hypothetical protein